MNTWKSRLQQAVSNHTSAGGFGMILEIAWSVKDGQCENIRFFLAEDASPVFWHSAHAKYIEYLASFACRNIFRLAFPTCKPRQDSQKRLTWPYLTCDWNVCTFAKQQLAVSMLWELESIYNIIFFQVFIFTSRCLLYMYIYIFILYIYMGSTEETMMEATIFSWLWWRPFAGILYPEFHATFKRSQRNASWVEAHGNSIVLNTFDNHSWKQKNLFW